MATGFTHTFVAIAGAKLAYPEKTPHRFYPLVVLCSLLPDLDVIAFRLHIPYGNPFGHRGFSHSLAFAALLGLVVALLAFRDVPRWSRSWWKLAGFFFLVTASHGVLDAMTNGGYGIGFFVPFDNTRYFLPWRPLVVSPIGIRGFLSRWGWDVVMSELIWIWVPVLLVLAGVHLYRRMLRSRNEGSPNF